MGPKKFDSEDQNDDDEIVKKVDYEEPVKKVYQDEDEPDQKDAKYRKRDDSDEE